MLGLNLSSEINPTAQGGFSLVAMMVVFACLAIFFAGFSSFINTSASAAKFSHARLEVQLLVLKVFRVLQEEPICSRSNINQGISLNGMAKGEGSPGRLKRLGTLTVNFNGVTTTIAQIGRFMENIDVEGIDVNQDTPIYGENPLRASGNLTIFGTMYGLAEAQSQQRKSFSQTIPLVLSGGSPVTSCYTVFSRNLACSDFQGIYDKTVAPFNCQN